jgi:DNA-binding XRE family transcriptional regulator
MSESPPDKLGSSVRRYREALELSQGDLAWLANVSRGTISNLETGRVTPDERTWNRVRTALGLRRVTFEELDEKYAQGSAHFVIPTTVTQSLVKAIISTQDDDNELGRRIAARWRRLIVNLTSVGYSPNAETGSELAWFASFVADTVTPERLTTIHEALQQLGWTSDTPVPAEESREPSVSTKGLAPLRQSVERMAKDLQRFRDDVRGFERLPVRVQDLLNRGLVVDYDIDRQQAGPGIAVIDLVILDEDESTLVSRRALLEATRRWSNILMLTRYIYESVAPDKDPDTILDALKRGLDASASD